MIPNFLIQLIHAFAIVLVCRLGHNKLPILFSVLGIICMSLLTVLLHLEMGIGKPALHQILVQNDVYTQAFLLSVVLVLPLRLYEGFLVGEFLLRFDLILLLSKLQTANDRQKENEQSSSSEVSCSSISDSSEVDRLLDRTGYAESG